MKPIRPVMLSGIATLLCWALAACDSGPKTYDDCMLLASRSSETDRQFNMMAKNCKDQFGHTLPLRAPPTAASKADDPPAKKP